MSTATKSKDVGDGVDGALLDINDFMSVYVGKNGACCCGCSGDHAYPEALRDMGLYVRGYELTDSEVSDRRFKVRLTRLAKLLREGKVDIVSRYFISAVDGNTLVTGYFKHQYLVDTLYKAGRE